MLLFGNIRNQIQPLLDVLARVVDIKLKDQKGLTLIYEHKSILYLLIKLCIKRNTYC